MMPTLSAAAALAVWWMLHRLAVVSAQTTTNTTTTAPGGANASNGTTVVGCDPTAPVHSCCDKMGEEIDLACAEFWKIGTDESSCKVWRDAGLRACRLNCGDCETVTKAVWDECYFTLQAKLQDLRLTQDYCNQMKSSMQFGRCPSLCELDRPSQCVNKNMFGNATLFPECNALCGNYRYCHCYRELQKFGQPDTCDGKTVLEGPVAGKPGLVHSCGMIPQDCKNHIFPVSKCGPIKYCQPDLCVVLNVSCPKFDTCQTAGFCLPATGQCSYSYKQDGETCDDLKYWTYNDRCSKGVCQGLEDLCIKHNVICKTPNPCLHSEGVCTPETGWCTYTQKEDGSQCDDDRPYVRNSSCYKGLCRGEKVEDVCQANKVICTAPDSCHKPGKCNPETGKCGSPRPLEGYACNDGNGNTNNDRCIEGRCVGDPWKEPKFRTLGQGHCKDSKGRVLPRYYADIMERDQCEEQCKNDVQCVAYSYGYYVCSIYGRMRTSPPHWEFWGDYSAARKWSFEPANVGKPDWNGPGISAHGDVGASGIGSSEAMTICYVRGSVGDKEESSLLMKIIAFAAVTFFVIVVPASCLFLPDEYLFCKPCRKRGCRRCCRRGDSGPRPKSKAESNGPSDAWTDKPMIENGSATDEDAVLPFDGATAPTVDSPSTELAEKPGPSSPANKTTKCGCFKGSKTKKGAQKSAKPALADGESTPVTDAGGADAESSPLENADKGETHRPPSAGVSLAGDEEGPIGSLPDKPKALGDDDRPIGSVPDEPKPVADR